MQDQPPNIPTPPQDLQNKGKSKRKSVLTTIVTIVVIVFVTVGTRVIINTQINKEKATPESLLKSEEITPYVSSEHGFTVDFPGFPSTEHSTLDIEGVSVPYTQYVKELNNGNNPLIGLGIPLKTSEKITWRKSLFNHSQWFYYWGFIMLLFVIIYDWLTASFCL